MRKSVLTFLAAAAFAALALSCSQELLVADVRFVLDEDAKARLLSSRPEDENGGRYYQGFRYEFSALTEDGALLKSETGTMYTSLAYGGVSVSAAEPVPGEDTFEMQGLPVGSVVRIKAVLYESYNYPASQQPSGEEIVPSFIGETGLFVVRPGANAVSLELMNYLMWSEQKGGD